MTAMQELIGWFRLSEISINSLNKKTTELLEKEREQIIEAFNQGYREGFDDIENSIYNNKDISDYNDANNYYQTYKNQTL